jgi:hypothetical protein
MTEMLARLIPVLLLVFAASAFATDDKGPLLAELMKQKGYVYAWDGMLSGETPPPWVAGYAKSLDGPPVPTIPVPLDGETYTLGFVSKPMTARTISSTCCSRPSNAMPGACWSRAGGSPGSGGPMSESKTPSEAA